MTRRCEMWVSPWVPVGQRLILDTAALADDERRHVGRDAFPEDCLLVIVTPADNARLTKQAAEQAPYPRTSAAIAADIIEARCQEEPGLRARLRWSN